jgi:hypothetical protein
MASKAYVAASAIEDLILRIKSKESSPMKISSKCNWLSIKHQVSLSPALLLIGKISQKSEIKN